MSVNFNLDAMILFRGINYANYNLEKPQDTPVIDLAGQEEYRKDNKSAITVALEDFTERVRGCNEYNSSNLTIEDTEVNYGEKLKNALFAKEDSNIFTTEDGKEIINEKGNLFQRDIFKEENVKNYGIRYAEIGDEIYSSALNFAKADFGAIEKAYERSCASGSNNGKLNKDEVSSYTGLNGKEALDIMELIDLDGDKKTITPEEYASYLVASDGLKEENGIISFQKDGIDGKVSSQEADLFENPASEDVIKKSAQEIYNSVYK